MLIVGKDNRDVLMVGLAQLNLNVHLGLYLQFSGDEEGKGQNGTRQSETRHIFILN